MNATRRALLSGWADSTPVQPAPPAGSVHQEAGVENWPVRPKHTGPHPDDPGLPAVDALAVLLARTSYGARAAEWAEAQSIGFAGWLSRQLDDDGLDDSGVESLIATSLPRVGWSHAQLLADARASGNSRAAYNELLAASLLRQLLSPRQLFETMVEFWSDHFNIAALPSPEAFFVVADYRDVIRANALGRFEDLLRASARSLGMLFYLDNALNRANGPNENYARELMELHTLGVDGGYTEQDIREVARCFTGWSVTGLQAGAPAFAFIPAAHDFGSKLVLGSLIPSGRGIEDGEDVLGLLAAHPSTARYIARKLCIRFIADEPQDSVVAAVADSYQHSGGDIRSMLLTLFTSAEFQSSYDRKLRRPLEYVLACVRVPDARLDSGHVIQIIRQLQGLGQLLLQWPTPDGHPDLMSDWLSSGAMLSRWNWAFAIAEDRVPGIRLDIGALIGTARTPRQLLDALVLRLLRRALASGDYERLLLLAADGGSADVALSGATLVQRARELIATLLASNYFQYR